MATKTVTNPSVQLNTSAVTGFFAWVKNLFSGSRVNTSTPVNEAKIQMELNKARAQVHMYQTFR